MTDNGRTRYPLCWPAGVPRSKSTSRSRFGQIGRRVTTEQARTSLLHELKLFDASRVLISTNVELRRDGWPKSGRRPVSDTGVAVYFELHGRPMCVPCDRWDRVGDNLWAISKWVGAQRGMERWVGRDMVARSFTGFQALPAPGESSAPDWRFYFGLDPDDDRDEAKASIRRAKAYSHPDKPTGSREAWDKVLEMERLALAELGLG